MRYSPNDDPETHVRDALDEAATLTSDGAVRAFCQACRSGAEEGFSQAAARAALDSVWPMLSDVSVEDVWRRMEDDAKSRLSEPDVTRWAIAGALRAALERLRTQWTDERRLTDATLHRQRLAGLVAFRALQFAKTAKALRHEPPTHPPRFRAT